MCGSLGGAAAPAQNCIVHGQLLTRKGTLHRMPLSRRRSTTHSQGVARTVYRLSFLSPHQLRQLGEVRRQPPRLVARQPIWSPSGATQRYVRNRGRSGSARLALETTLMTRSRPRRGLSISPGSNSRPFLSMISSARGKEGAADRGRNAATYAVSEIPRLRAAPIMPASAIIISTLTKPPA